MQHSRAQSILMGQSKMAQRVFAAVPMQSFWTVEQIIQEMKRLEGIPQRPGEVLGCLRCLVDAGLVNETASTTFRSTVKPPKEQQQVEPKKKQEAPKPTFMDRLAAQAQQLRVKAEVLIAQANELDSLALEVDEAILQASEGNAKFQELQATLKKLMG